MSEIRDRVKTRIKNIIYGHISGTDSDEDAKAILAIPELAIVDRKATPPPAEWTASPDSTPSVALKVAEGFRRAYAGWVKEVKNGS